MPFYRCSFGGTLAAGDVFQYGFHWQQTSADSAATVRALMDTFLTNQLSATFLSEFSPNTTWTFVKVQRIVGTTGLVDDVSESSRSTPGTSVNSSLPPQISVVVSTRTANQTRHGRGRFYLPPPRAGSNLQPNGTLNSTPGVANLITSTASAMNTLNTNPGQVVVAHFNGTAMEGFDVTSIKIGTVFDTQRRRRNKVPEVYTTSTITP
jgi:hypothetical protein